MNLRSLRRFLPVLLLVGLSLVTKQTTAQQVIDRFYAKMKTPVGATLQEDAEEVEKSYTDPSRFDHCKLFPNCGIELCKWTKEDWAGFLLSWLAVGAIILVLKVFLSLGR